jgi:hypothetical protein
LYPETHCAQQSLDWFLEALGYLFALQPTIK